MTPEHWRRVKDIFHSARELAPERRGEFVTAATAGDSELRREVEKMLRHCTGAGALDRPAWDGPPVQTGLHAGFRLGPYEILEQVGTGGMGRVYKARDTRLGRTVAIKVLSSEFTHRLRTEARAISALNHPHVCALYDIGDQDGAAYLVMEFVEGESLAAVISRGALPLDRVRRYGMEIASALAAAHEQAIVHRDLKPANIMITASGAKVLDFGVAQIAQDNQTSEGALVGTAAYMSPSQLNGNPAEARADVFALGLVLYEMASGTRRTDSSRVSLGGLPAGLVNVIERCLADGGDRIQRMDEVRMVLDRLRLEANESSRSRAAGVNRTAMALAIAAAATVIWVTNRQTPQPAPPPTVVLKPSSPAISVQAPEPRSALAPRRPKPARVLPAPPSLVTLASYPGMERDPSFSPDGARVAFSWHTGGPNGFGIYVRPVAPASLPTELTDGDVEDWGPAWSPDGRRIAFRRKSAQSGIYWVSVSGGPAKLVAHIARQGQETLPQMSWSHDGKWIAAPDRDLSRATRIYLFAADSGDKRPLTFNEGGTAHAPAFSPDGKSLAYALCLGSVNPCDVYVIDLARDLTPKGEHRITSEGVYIRGLAWLPDGRSLVYSAGRTFSTETYLWRVSVNPPGIPEPIEMAGSRARHPAISSGGLLAYTRLTNWNLMMIRNFR